MHERVKAIVKPEILVWARESAGMDLPEAASKLRVKVEKLEAWERGEDSPTVNQLRKLGNAYNRPLAVFYLPAPPRDFQAMQDYRRLPGHGGRTDSPKLRAEIRAVRARRDIALELYAEMNEEPPHFQAKARLSQDPDRLASSIRGLLGVHYEEQVAWKSGYAALSEWRGAIENAGALVFQVSGVEVAEMRGFSMHETPLPVVVVNPKDTPTGRIFSMLHEFVHVMLHQTGLCDMQEEGTRSSENQRVETFCNRVAGAVVVPRDRLLQELEVVEQGPETEWRDDRIASLARRYGVSREVVLRRLLICGRTTQRFYRFKRQEYARQYRGSTPGQVPQFRRVLASTGPTFARLVLNSYYQERISVSSVSEYLNVKVKHLGRIEHAVMGREIQFEA